MVGEGSRLGFVVVEVLPKAAFLFNAGFIFGEGEMGAEGKVRVGMPMQNVVRQQGAFGGFKVDAELADADDLPVDQIVGRDERLDLLVLVGELGARLEVRGAGLVPQPSLDLSRGGGRYRIRRRRARRAPR